MVKSYDGFGVLICYECECTPRNRVYYLCSYPKTWFSEHLKKRY